MRDNLDSPLGSRRKIVGGLFEQRSSAWLMVMIMRGPYLVSLSCNALAMRWPLMTTMIRVIRGSTAAEAVSA